MNALRLAILAAVLCAVGPSAAKDKTQLQEIPYKHPVTAMDETEIPARIGTTLKFTDIETDFNEDHNEYKVVVRIDGGENGSAPAIRALINFASKLNDRPEAERGLRISLDTRCLLKEMLDNCEVALVPKVEALSAPSNALTDKKQ